MRLRDETGAVPAALSEWAFRLREIKVCGPGCVPAAGALTRPLPRQAYVLANPTTTAAPGATGQRLLAELEKIRQWDVKYHYNAKKRGAAHTAAAAPTSPPPAAPAAMDDTNGDSPAGQHAASRQRVARSTAARRIEA